MKTAARWVLAAGLVLLILGGIGMCQPAFGQAGQQPPTTHEGCLPAQLGGTGTRYELFETAAVSGRVGWCPVGDGRWYTWVHQWCRKDLCNKLPAHATVTIAAATDRIANATDKWAQVKEEWKVWAVPLTTDMQRWELRDWRHQACQWLTSTVPGVTPQPPLPIPLPNITPQPVLPTTYCEGYAPGPKPEPPAEAWRTVGGTIYKLTLGPPARLVSATTRKAPQNLACVDALVIPVGAKTFKRFQGGAQDEAAECIK